MAVVVPHVLEGEAAGRVVVNYFNGARLAPLRHHTLGRRVEEVEVELLVRLVPEGVGRGREGE